MVQHHAASVLEVSEPPEEVELHQSVVARAIFFAVIFWGTGIKANDASRRNKVSRIAGSVVGSRLATLEEVLEQRMPTTLLAIMNNTSHPPQ